MNFLYDLHEMAYQQYPPSAIHTKRMARTPTNFRVHFDVVPTVLLNLERKNSISVKAKRKEEERKRSRNSLLTVEW